MINVALPKGRLGERAYEAFASAGYDCPAILEKNRRLTFENREKGVRYFWVKPSDVSIYVERGAADVGVAGRDILLEYEPDVYELLDLGIGRCRMCVAGPENFYDAPGRTLRVASKFPHITAEHYTVPRHRHHQAQRLHRAGSHPGPVRRDCGHCGDGQDPAGKPPGAFGDHCGHQRVADQQSGELSIQASGDRRDAGGPGAEAVRRS